MNVQQILGLVMNVLPIVDGLVKWIGEIKSKTQDEYPEMWAKVKTDWDDAVNRWNTTINS